MENKQWLGRDVGRNLAPALCLIAVLLFMAASAQPASAATGSDNPAYVRVIHASPDIGVVDVFVDGNRILTSFAYATVTGYVPIPPGSHEVQIALIGKGVNAAILAQKVQVQAGVPYTIAGLGTKSMGFSFGIFEDNNYVTGSTPKVRIYHLNPGAGAAEVTSANQQIVQDLVYSQASQYVPVSTGTHTFNLNMPPTTTDPVSLNLKPWTVNSIFALKDLSQKQKVQFVTAQIQGWPGMPNTGSDPTPRAKASTSSTPDMPFAPWLAGLLAGAVLATSLVIQRSNKNSQKITRTTGRVSSKD